MKKTLLTVVACALGASACTHERDLTDAQLTTLLQSDRPASLHAGVHLDDGALQCMRGWSGVSDLQRGLPMNFAGEDGKKVCRARLDGWLADTARNPDKFAFTDLAAPKNVRRAMALQSDAKGSAALPGKQPVPPGLVASTPPPGVEPLLAPDPTADLGVHGAQLSEAETLCQQIQQRATAPDAHDDLKAFAGYCAGTLRKLRGTMEQDARRTPDPTRLAAFAASADKLSGIARKLLASSK